MTIEELRQQLAKAEARARALEEELAETNRGLVALTLEMEQRVDQRTAELRQLNQELEARVHERTAQLRQANEQLQDFAHSAAHDLRSPLRAIRNFSGIVLEDYGTRLDAEGQAMLQRVRESAAQMQRLLDDLLEYSKLSAEELKLERVSLKSAVREALALLDGDIRAKNAAVTVGEPLPEVIGHSATVVLVINNFVSNALKFVSPGVQPQIHIWAEVRDTETRRHGDTEKPLSASPRLRVSASRLVRLSVLDNGIGIEPGDLGKLFKVFQRLHGKGAYPGTGLGLAMVRKAVGRMGGEVGVESSPGRGSCFWFELTQASGAS